MLEGVSIPWSEKVKDELVLDGNDIELVSRSAALINQVTFLHNLFLHTKKQVVYYLQFLRIQFLVWFTEMPCQEQRYPEISLRYLR